jgi:Mlc titration factor MtfA (ptsG expression regulator)
VEYLPILIFVVVVLAIVGTIVVNFYQIVSAILSFFFRDYYNRHLIFIRRDPKIRAFLETNFKYYQRLNAEDKLIFERRVIKFIRMKTFEPRGDLKEIRPEMKILIAASAIQITFGFPSLYFRHFDTILLYPDAYRSTITGNYHHGEVNTRGIIVLSWSRFLEGYHIDNDGRNLGLHEMAHALKIADAIHSDDYDFLDSALMRTFISLARAEMQRINGGEKSFFRDYAATDDHEFFAVAVENFFERPEAFRQSHPQMFKVLTELLNQERMVGVGSPEMAVIVATSGAKVH